MQRYIEDGLDPLPYRASDEDFSCPELITAPQMSGSDKTAGNKIKVSEIQLDTQYHFLSKILAKNNSQACTDS